MQKIIEFGNGTVSVVAGFASEDESRTVDRVVIEPGMGSGVIGELPSRELQKEFDPNDDATVLIFSNAESVGVVIGQLQEVERSLKA